MRIETPMEIEQVAWEGYLEPAGEVYRSGELPKVTLGEPAWWTADALQAQTGKAWSLPAGGQCFTLVRLACTLHPLRHGGNFAEATLTATLRPEGGTGQAIAHDLYPVRETAEQTGKFGARLGPDLKFGPVDASIAEASVEIDLHQVFPVVQAFGLGETQPYWKFARHRAHPLLGSQYVYAVVAAPPDAGAVHLDVELVASVDSGWVPVLFRTPRQGEARISRSVPVDKRCAGAGPRTRPLNMAVLRDLLQEAFSPHTLRTFCQDRESFRPLLTVFGPNDGLAAMVGHVIDYCGQKYLWDELLAGVKKENPGQWARFESELGG